MILGLAAIGSATPSRGVRYQTPNSQVQISWNGEGGDWDNSRWGSRTGGYGGWKPAKYGSGGDGSGGDGSGGDGSSSSEEGGNGGSGGSGGKYGGKGGDGDSDGGDNNANDGEENQADISIKTSTDKDGNVQKEIDIEMTIDGKKHGSQTLLLQNPPFLDAI